MNQIIALVYKKIFGQDLPETLSDWQVAEKVLEQFNVPKLGEELAKKFIHQLVNYIDYPDKETTTRIVGRAEGLASELWEELPDEPHMAEIGRLEYLGEHKKQAR